MSLLVSELTTLGCGERKFGFHWLELCTRYSEAVNNLTVDNTLRFPEF